MNNYMTSRGNFVPQDLSTSNVMISPQQFSTSKAKCLGLVPSNNAETIGSELLSTNSTMEHIANWFLSKELMSNKKLQKLCYYAYCWYIVFFNDLETINCEAPGEIQTLSTEKFQAWIHGSVLPRLYHRYKEYGWQDIPQTTKPSFPAPIESLLQQVWNAYGRYSADDLEMLSHSESPWINARKGIERGEACTNEISDIDILAYYSNLG